MTCCSTRISIPLFLTLKNPDGGFKPYSSTKGQHGFRPIASTSPKREFSDWLVLENQAAGESMLVGGEPGLGVLGMESRCPGFCQLHHRPRRDHPNKR